MSARCDVKKMEHLPDSAVQFGYGGLVPIADGESVYSIARDPGL
jgi:hypothetical protein